MCLFYSIYRDGKNTYFFFNFHFINSSLSYFSHKLIFPRDSFPGNDPARFPLISYKIFTFLKRSRQSRRRNFKRVGLRDNIFNIKMSCQLTAHIGTIVDCHSSFFVNIYPEEPSLVCRFELYFNKLKALVIDNRRHDIRDLFYYYRIG